MCMLLGVNKKAGKTKMYFFRRSLFDNVCVSVYNLFIQNYCKVIVNVKNIWTFTI